MILPQLQPLRIRLVAILKILLPIDKIFYLYYTLTKKSNLKKFIKMKKIVFLSVVLIIFVFFAGCEKPELPTPTVFHTLTTLVNGRGSVNPDKLSGIPLGSSVTLKFIPETGYSLYSVKINGVKIEDIQPSSGEVSWTIFNVNKNQEIEVLFIETDILLLSKLEPAWMWSKLDIYRASDNSFMYEVELTQAEKSRKMYHYYPSMEIKYINPDGSVYWQATWNLTSDVYKQGGQNLTVLDLTHNKFVHKAPPIWSNVNNCYIYAQYTYERK